MAQHSVIVLPLVHPVCRARHVKAHRFFEILARTERAVARTGHDDCADGWIGIVCLEHRDNLITHHGIPCVELLGAIQGNDPDAVYDVGQNEFVHRQSLLLYYNAITVINIGQRQRMRRQR